jgi:hypothetical protein
MLYVYDHSGVKGSPLRFKDIMRHVEERIGSSPIFRQRGIGQVKWLLEANLLTNKRYLKEQYRDLPVCLPNCLPVSLILHFIFFHV